MPVRKLVRRSVIATLVALPLLASPAAAQARGQRGQQAPSQPAVTAENVSLVYEREVFTYQGTNRRDPFRPLTSSDQAGPRFENLTLQGIIYSTGQGRSLALLADTDGRVFRVRVGDVVGNSRVVEVGPLRVVLAVEDFGQVRQEMLELKKREGADQ